MDYFSAGWLLALIVFVVGIGVGFFIYKLKYSDDARSQKLQDELARVTEDFENYKESVTEHFSKTSELVNNLTEDYVKVYKHLAKSAEALTDVQITPQLTSAKSSPMVSFINEVENASGEAGKVESIEPPKDYAPKEEEAQGTLSESYSVGSTKAEKLKKESA
ncbi:MAG: YhcB family protein [Pseudomonadales bacterium]|nr:YhcB family protein [Pseudomonadales bacterium]